MHLRLALNLLHFLPDFDPLYALRRAQIFYKILLEYLSWKYFEATNEKEKINLLKPPGFPYALFNQVFLKVNDLGIYLSLLNTSPPPPPPAPLFVHLGL
jgi:hypothetical protein